MPKLFETAMEKMGWLRSEKAAPPAVIGSGGADPFAIWRSSKKVLPEKAFEVYHGWVYACIRAIAEEIAGMNFVLNKINDDGTEERIYEHPILDILAQPNPQMTGIEFLYTIAAHLEAVGNAYCYLEDVDDETGKPKALYIANAARMRVKVNRDQFPHQISHYEYRVETKTLAFTPHQLIHLKYPDPSDPFEGVGTVQSIAQWVDGDNYAMEFNRRFFLNGARIGVVLESEAQRTPEQLEYMKKSFEAIAKGVENAFKILALPTGVKVSDMGQTQKDLDFANLMTMMRDRILAGFRVPRTVLGITDDVNRANAEATDYVFATRTIKPKMKLIVAYLNEFLVPRYGEKIYLSFEDPTPENRELRIREVQMALGNQPAMSVNEAREEYFGLPSIENGDDVMADFNKIPLGKPEKKEVRKPRTKAVAVGGKRARTRFARNAETRKNMTNELAVKAAEAMKDLFKNFKKTKKRAKKVGVHKLTDAEYDAVYKAFFTRVSPYEKAVKEGVRKVNSEQQKAVLELADKKLKSEATDFLAALATLLGADEWPALMVGSLTPALTDLMTKEGKEAGEFVGFDDLNVMTPEVEEALDRSLSLMADRYNQATLDLLEERLKDGFEQGLSLDELKERISEVYDFSDSHRAEQVARTETFRVANEATKEAWKQTGVVKTIKWYTAVDERVCEFCDDMHDKVIGIDETFFEKDDVAEGRDGGKMSLDYDAVGHPPLHVSCRCYIRPEDVEV